ncbi:MAG: hypothetical protein IJA61_04025 [Clostridia bacterium]|nr:hypothetical protein [Clostridia bacterium]
MSTKQKIAVSIIAAVMTLAIVGLAIGLILVAQQVQVTSTVSVTYKANNVVCDIKAYAVHSIVEYENGEDNIQTLIANGLAYSDEVLDTEKFEAIKFESGEVFITDNIHAYEQNTEDLNYLEKKHSFENVVLRPIKGLDDKATSSIAWYCFEITNNAVAGGMMIGVKLKQPTDRDNITISRSSSSVVTIAPGETELVYFSVKVTDVSKDAEFNDNLVLEIEQYKAPTLNGGGSD